MMPALSDSIAAMLALLGLFSAAFIAATLLPAQSEAVLVALLLQGHPLGTLVLVATLGNVLGSCVNWWLGRQALRFQDRRWFPVGRVRLAQAQGWYRRYGRWTLLASWLPVVGDPITLVAGVMREPLRTFLPIVTVAKAGRYLVLGLLTLQVI